MRRFRLTISVASLITILVGCASIDHISPESKELATLTNQVSSIQVGVTDREAVRREMGELKFSSHYWRFDLFRDETVQTLTARWVLLPFPTAQFTDKLQRFTLISYDANGRVNAMNSGIFRKVPGWRSTEPIEKDFLSLKISTDDLALLMDPWVKGENLLVNGNSRDAYFTRLAKAPECTLVVGAGARGFGIRLSIDGNPDFLLPTRIPEYLSGTPTLADIKLTPGEHLMEFTSKYTPGNKSFTHSCKPGDVKYLQVDITGDEQHLSWAVDQWDRLPSLFADRPLVLIYEGEWRVMEEPSHY